MKKKHFFSVRGLCRTGRTSRTGPTIEISLLDWISISVIQSRTIEKRNPFAECRLFIVIQQSDLDHAVFRGIIQPDLQEGPLQPR